MTTATVDITDIEKISIDETYISKLNSAIGIDETEVINRNDDNYYYSSGSFNFILDRGFKPETLENTALTPIPFLPEWHQGIVSIHGVIIPVIDILSFAKSQNIDVKESKTKKTYLLKLEHEDYSPIVFKLDSIPHLVNTESFKGTNKNNSSRDNSSDNTPDWIKSYLGNDVITLALVDHQKLFDQLIKIQ